MLLQLKIKISGTTNSIGYTTIDVDPIDIINPKFGITIKFYYSEGLIYTYEQTKGLYNNMKVEKGLSFVSADGIDWSDLVIGAKNQIAPIRAYTDNVNEEDYNYSFSKDNVSTEADKITVTYNYSNINLEDISYNIFSANDKDYLNILTYDFDVINNLGTEKSIIIKKNNNTKEGDYVLVVKVKDTLLIENFSVYTNENELTFIEPEKSDKDKDVEIIVIDNPKNEDEYSKTDDEVTKNSKTGDILILIPLIVGAGALIYTAYYFKNKKEVN